MKPLYTSVLAILATVTIVGMLTIGTQQIYAPRTCGQCSEFKKLTTEFEKDVLSQVTEGQDPDTTYRQLATLFDDYQQETFRIFELTPPTGTSLIK
jgi:NADH:ubiquinone oxidoreductase subunit F (NADH-binding)